jgi:diacylglycerol kinase family enzyme
MSKKNKPMRAKIIANLGAGNVLLAASRLEQVTSYLLENEVKVDVALAKPKKEAIPIARKAVKDGYDVMIAMGRDGTLRAVIRGIAGSKVRLGIIPAGTENDIARSLGIPEDLKEACALIASGHTRKLDLGQISTRERKFLFLYGVFHWPYSNSLSHD